MRKITEIIVHCTATPAGRDVRMADVETWHRARGFRRAGYHYLVCLDGHIEAGRPEAETGAHCRGHNHCSIGVAYVGGVLQDGRTTADTRTPQQKTALRALLEGLVQRYPAASIYPHSRFAAKACPCFDAAKEYSALCRKS